MCDVTHFRLNLAKQLSFERAIIGILRQLFSRGEFSTPYVISQRAFESVQMTITLTDRRVAGLHEHFRQVHV